MIGRNNRTGLQVWSAEWGYPGEYGYREFHKKDGVSGMQYWRVTGPQVDLAQKEADHPDWAAHKAGLHAGHFANLVEEITRECWQTSKGEFGIVSANYDTELFGHWWFEGVDWLQAVLRRLSGSKVVDMTTASDFLEAHAPQTVVHIPEGSWGAGGAHFVWDNADTGWMWPVVHEAERRMLQMVQSPPAQNGANDPVLNQAARELLLLQSSDWPFLVTTGQAKEYAIERFEQHLGRFTSLLDSIDRQAPDHELAVILWEKDKVFPGIDWRWFQQ